MDNVLLSIVAMVVSIGVIESILATAVYGIPVLGFFAKILARVVYFVIILICIFGNIFGWFNPA